MVRSLPPLVVMAAGLLPVYGAAQPSDPNLGRNIAATCANCHGTQGRSVGGMTPLAGRPRADLERVLREFREGRRPATIMHQLAQGFSEQQLEAVSEYLSAQMKPD